MVSRAAFWTGERAGRARYTATSEGKRVRGPGSRSFGPRPMLKGCLLSIWSSGASSPLSRIESQRPSSARTASLLGTGHRGSGHSLDSCHSFCAPYCC